MIFKDDRDVHQKQSHNMAVVARDTFLSGWGDAKGGYSRVAWACSPDVDIDKVFAWVKNRGDMVSVNIVDLRTYNPKGGSTKHFHIYVVNEGHPSTE